MIIIKYISDIMNIYRPIFFITAGIINLDLICRWYIRCDERQREI